MKDGDPGEGTSTVFLQHLLMQKNSGYTKLTLRAKITAWAIILPDNIESTHINLLANSDFFFNLIFFVISLCIFLALGEGFTMQIKNTKTILHCMPKGTK